MAALVETSLYLPVKRFHEGQGFEVKGEVCGCDIVGVRGTESPLLLIAELKLSVTLELSSKPLIASVQPIRSIWRLQALAAAGIDISESLAFAVC